MLQRTPGNTGRGRDGGGVESPVGLRWQADVGAQTWSAPIVADGRVVACGDEGTITAFEVRDGTTLWNRQIDDSISAAPAIADGTVYVPVDSVTDEPGVVALATTDGAVRWRSTAAVQTPGLTVVDGVVYARDRNRVWALDADSGSVRWQVEVHAYEPHPPAVVGETIYVGGVEGRIHALATSDGTERWQTSVAGSIDSAPTVADGTVVVESGDFVGGISALDASDGTIQWQSEIHRHGLGSPAVVDGTVYAASQERWIYAFDADDGTRRWRTRNEGVFKSSPAVVDDTVYVGSVDNSVHALSTADGSTRWQFELSDWVTTSPAVVDGTVFVGSRDGKLYALEHQESLLSIPGFGVLGALVGTGLVAGYRLLQRAGDE